MLLWVFEGDGAYDCFGAIVVVAYDFEEVKRLVAERPDCYAWKVELYEDEKVLRPYTGSSSRFFLKETIPAPGEKPRVILVSWTWQEG